jgi:hypothetical protein
MPPINKANETTAINELKCFLFINSIEDFVTIYSRRLNRGRSAGSIRSLMDRA